MSLATHVYTGPWINYSQNSTVLGATITLTARDGAFLVAFLALVVATAGASFWTIISYSLYQLQSIRDFQDDAIFRQQQAILKNSSTALNAALKFAQVSWSWRKHTRSRWWQFWKSRTLSYVSLALILAAAFGAASIFSSEVTKAAGNQFLVRSPNCGYWGFPDVVTNSAWEVKVLNNSLAAASYARDCYHAGTEDNLRCSTYNVPEIKWTNNQNASCPFATDACLITNTAAYEMDTGPVDSQDILGLNSKASERVVIRKVATCAPITINKYIQYVNVTLDEGRYIDEYMRLFLGPIPGVGMNFTYQYNTHESFVNTGYDFQ